MLSRAIDRVRHAVGEFFVRELIGLFVVTFEAFFDTDGDFCDFRVLVLVATDRYEVIATRDARGIVGRRCFGRGFDDGAEKLALGLLRVIFLAVAYHVLTVDLLRVVSSISAENASVE